MRRISEDHRSLFQSLVDLPPTRRLFVQRWMELFDRDVIYTERARPISADYIAEELNGHERIDFHVPLMEEEFTATPKIHFEDIRISDVDNDPVEAAQRLAAVTISAGFHPGFLYHAFKPLLAPQDTQFEERYTSLLNWWSLNKLAREITIVFRPTGAGVPPVITDKTWCLKKWADFTQPLRDSVDRESDWWRQFGDYAESGQHFLCFKCLASDADQAASLAAEAYEQYRVYQISLRKKPIPIDTRWVLVYDPNELPSGSTHAFRYHPYRFRLPSQLEPSVLVDLAELERKDVNFGYFRQAYSKALENIRRGVPKEALADLAQGIDIAMHDYRPAATEKDWGQPRLLVEKGAIVLALDWPYRHFRYFIDYIRKPSYTVIGEYLLGNERRPEVILKSILDQASWDTAIARAPWDELLKWRRDLIFKICWAGPEVIKRQRQLARWDLARAVRARNILVHRGQPVRDAYLIAVLLHMFENLIRLRVHAHRVNLTFDQLIKMAEQDYGRFSTTAFFRDEFVAFGWQKMRSRQVITKDA